MEADTNFFVIKEDKLLGAIDSSENNLVPFRYTSFRNLGFGFSLWESKSNNHLFSKNLYKNMEFRGFS